MAPDRQTIIETNRSLRNIKNELENLLEKGMISDEAYEGIHGLLPAESPLSGAGAARAAANAPTPTASPNPPTDAMANMNVRSAPSPAPPSYAQTGPPSLPSRNAEPPAKPVLAHARALYRYAASDARDVSFEKEDRIAIHEYMNADWWMGKNLRTGQEGIFPKTYVLVEQNEKSGYNSYAPPQQPMYAQPGYGPPSGPPPQQNPYNADAPPMEAANQSSGGGEGAGKAQEYGKKFGKKLGNAAIFGAGATIGSNIVNSIF